MSNSLEPFDSNLRALDDPDLILAVDIIIEKAEAHPGLQDVPVEVPGPAVLKPCKLEFAATVMAMATGEFDQEKYDTQRNTLVENVIMWGQFIVMRSKMRKDPSLLENSGMPPKKTVVRTPATSKGPTPVPKGKVKRGKPKEFIFTLEAIPLTGIFEIRYTTNPEDPSSWIEGDQSTYCRFTRDGFTPGTKYYFSFRFHGPNGTSDWSAPVGIYAVDEEH